jgi:hypothetical protein
MPIFPPPAHDTEFRRLYLDSHHTDHVRDLFYPSNTKIVQVPVRKQAMSERLIF